MANIFEQLKNNFEFEPTADQANAMQALADLHNKNILLKCFLLRGYAGTGKTTMIKAIANTFKSFDYKIVLLAPTGRAAKVMAMYSQSFASTIHRKIYQFTTDESGFHKARLWPIEKRTAHTIFIVDEASMISDERTDPSALNSHSLLDDLIEYVYSNANNYIVFVGDGAQLPPVDKALSPALDKKYLTTFKNLYVEDYELREVVRQKKESGIIMNATSLRILINRMETEPILKTIGFKDIKKISGVELADELESSYSKSSIEEVLVVCRSNKQANQYNKFIRNRFLYREEEIGAGDLMMIVKNNYYWLNDMETSNGFIANGDVVKIKRVGNIETKFGFRFVDATIILSDYENNFSIDVKLLLDTIEAEAPALSREKSNLLYNAILLSYADEKKTVDRKRKVMQDPFFNALQVKFSYAVTCHKAQGGQWHSVFIDQGFMKQEMYSTEHLRWLYTAITRATTKLFLVNFEDRFFRKA